MGIKEKEKLLHLYDNLKCFFAFIFKPLLVYLNLFVFFKETNYLHLFLGYVSVGAVSKIVTNVFIYLEKKAKNKKV